MQMLRIRRALTLGLIILIALTGKTAFAQTGVIAFRDGCTQRFYAMRGDGSGRVELPLPWPVLPDDLSLTTSFWMSRPVVRRQSFITLNIIRTGFSDNGVFAVQVDDVGGFLVPHSPIPLTLQPIAGVDPNNATRGSFVSAPTGDRMALVVTAADGRQVLLTARIERDSNLKIIGLSDSVAVGDLDSIGTPDPEFPTERGFTGYIDYSPDGRSIVASIYYDLWRSHLRDDNTTPTPLTNTNGTSVETWLKWGW